MPIKEIPQILEFSCTLENMEDVVWNVKCDPNIAVGLHIEGNGQSFHCPVDLFKEVTSFLQSKGILKPNTLTRTVSGIPQGSFASTLLPPVVERQTTVSIPAIEGGPPPDPLTSFDIGNIPKSEVIVTEVSQPEGIAAGIVVNANTQSEIKSRPVIRTRVSGADPQSAEKEAAAIRGIGVDGDKKTVKKRHQKE